MLFTATFLLHAGMNFVLGIAVAGLLGPAEFGRYAIGAAVAVLVNAVFFYWLGFSASRWYSQETRTSRPEIRATLDRSLASLATLACLGGLALAVLWPGRDGMGAIVGLGVVAGLAQGLFDYACTLARARFEDRLFARITVVKTLASFAVMLAVAVVTRDAVAVLAAMSASIALGLWVVRRPLLDAPLSTMRIDPALLREFLRYCAPLILSLVVYQLVPFVNRGFLAAWYGFGESGQFSLAYDTLGRIMFALGASLEFILFQVAVRAEETQGRKAAEEQLGRNLVLVAGLLLPAALGFWLLLPAITGAIVPDAFRDGFSGYATLLLPAVIAQALITSALNAVFQIQKRTAPAAAAALAAVVTDLVLCLVLPRWFGPHGLAMAQSGAILAALATTVAFAFPVLWREVRGRDLAVMGLGLLAMALVLAGWRGALAPWAALALGIPLGALFYGAVVLAGDMAGARRFAQDRLRSRA